MQSIKTVYDHTKDLELLNANNFNVIKLNIESGKPPSYYTNNNGFTPLIAIVRFINIITKNIFTQKIHPNTIKSEKEFMKIAALLLYHGLDVYARINIHDINSPLLVDYFRKLTSTKHIYKLFTSLISNKIRSMFYYVLFRARFVPTTPVPTLYNIINDLDVNCESSIIIRNKTCKKHQIFNDKHLILHICSYL